MKAIHVIPSIILLAVLSAGLASTQKKAALGDNAALRYWSAFSQVQDSAITNEQAKELNAILDGTAPYADLKYRDLVEKNKLALVIMARATELPNCDWGLDYRLGEDEPVEYVRKALVLGRLNVLYAFHLLKTGDKDGSVNALAAGVRFSRDVANGGTLFATVVAEDLLVVHLRAMAFAVHLGELSGAQRSVLQRAVAQLGPHGLDWQSAMRREMKILNKPDWQVSVPLARVTEAYVAALTDPSTLPKLQQELAAVPQPLRDVIPSPERVLDEKQELDSKILQTQSLLQ